MGLLAFYTNSMISGGWYFNYNSVTTSYIIVGIYLFWLEGTLKKEAAHASTDNAPPVVVVPFNREIRRLSS
jgi:hypothetical protein